MTDKQILEYCKTLILVKYSSLINDAVGSIQLCACAGKKAALSEIDLRLSDKSNSKEYLKLLRKIKLCLISYNLLSCDCK